MGDRLKLVTYRVSFLKWGRKVERDVLVSGNTRLEGERRAVLYALERQHGERPLWCSVKYHLIVGERAKLREEAVAKVRAWRAENSLRSV